jgi:hypothetical protein
MIQLYAYFVTDWFSINFFDEVTNWWYALDTGIVRFRYKLYRPKSILAIAFNYLQWEYIGHLKESRETYFA